MNPNSTYQKGLEKSSNIPFKHNYFITTAHTHVRLSFSCISSRCCMNSCCLWGGRLPTASMIAFRFSLVLTLGWFCCGVIGIGYRQRCCSRDCDSLPCRCCHPLFHHWKPLVEMGSAKVLRSSRVCFCCQTDAAPTSVTHLLLLHMYNTLFRYVSVRNLGGLDVQNLENSSARPASKRLVESIRQRKFDGNQVSGLVSQLI
jgi:hypothetical protein